MEINALDKKPLNRDISQKPDSLGFYLSKHMQGLDKKTPEEMLQIIADAKTKGVSLGKYEDQILIGIKQKLEGFLSKEQINKANAISDFIPLLKDLDEQVRKLIKKNIMFYITNMILGSANLRIDRGAELEAMTKTSSLNELIILSVLYTTNTNL